jgi:hypothetical protein
MPYRQHLSSSTDLITPYEEIRAGFVALATAKRTNPKKRSEFDKRGPSCLPMPLAV